MIKTASFYRRSEKLFEGTLNARRVVDLSTTNVGYIRTTGKDLLRIRGISEQGVDISETVSQRISSVPFNYINYIEPVSSTFIGTVSLTDAGGSVIPVNRFLFAFPVEVVYSYLTGLRQSGPFRTQETIGVTPVDNAILLIARFNQAKDLKVGDWVSVGDDVVTIRNLHKIREGYWQIQAIIKSPL